MKTVFKQFSKKTLSLIIALAVVICSFGTTLSTFMDFGAKAVGVEHFKVTYGSPAVPMFEKTTINLYDLKVQFQKDGAFVDGTDITWSAEAGTSAAEFLNATNKTFSALGTGIFKVTATETANTANTKAIYIMVNKKDDFEFVLAKETGLDSALTFNADKWLFANGEGTDPSDKTFYYNAAGLQNMMFKNVYGGDTRVAFYRNDVLADFADYTVNTSMKIEGENGTKPFRGVIVRAQLNPDLFNADGTIKSTAAGVFANDGNLTTAGAMGVIKPGTSAMYLTSYNFGGLSVRGYYAKAGTEAIPFTNDTKEIRYDTLADNSIIKIVNRNPNYVLSTYSDSAITAVTGYRNIEYKVQGNDIVYSIDGNVIFDTVNNSTVNKQKVSCGYDNVLGADWNVEGKMPPGGDFDHPFTEPGTKAKAEINNY